MGSFKGRCDLHPEWYERVERKQRGRGGRYLSPVLMITTPGSCIYPSLRSSLFQAYFLYLILRRVGQDWMKKEYCVTGQWLILLPGSVFCMGG